MGTALIVVGGAARVHLPNGGPHTVMSDPDFLPDNIVPTARASMAQWGLCASETSANWTYANPPALLQPGPRLGTYRTGTNTLLDDEPGKSQLSMEDFAVALGHEAQSANFRRAAFTVGYQHSFMSAGERQTGQPTRNPRVYVRPSKPFHRFQLPVAPLAPS